MNSTLADLMKISHKPGADRALVQGGGGNTSVKTPDGKYMYIKASGTALKDMSAKQGWRRLRLDTVLGITCDKELARKDVFAREEKVTQTLLLACDDGLLTDARPSVESPLHAMLDRCVIHLHPWAVGAYVNAKNGRGRLEKLFAGEKYPFLWVPYADPGYMLCRQMNDLVAKYQQQHGRKPSVMFLEKHGLFVTAATAAAALRVLRRAMSLCQAGLKQTKPRRAKRIAPEQIRSAKLAIRRGVFEATSQYNIVQHCTNDIITAFMARPDTAKLLSGHLTPDEMIYANGSPLWVERCASGAIAKKLTRQIDKGGKPAAAFLVKDLGLFVAGNSKTVSVISDVATGSLFMRGAAARLGGLSVLNARQQKFINEWEAESFRHKLFAGADSGALIDRIAVVTGAGSGLGRSIAIGLARAGAYVAAADIDTVAAAETVAMIKKELPHASVIPMPCDVTDEQSVQAGFDSLLVQWGGLDIVVNAAGVAPAYPLVELPAAKWRFALEVNLTGYFLMARQAARIMIDQGMGGSIINLSSKSGLEASKNNTPYNATKAGELHMARGWALELGEHGIRVNSVCPGNVFEGSKIWNPAYIRTCAKKYGIKPEEVIPYYVDKTILKREIKGQDIADAVVFLCSDRARTITGQIIVPDAGQVPVR